MIPPFNSVLLKYYYILIKLSMSQINILLTYTSVINKASVNANYNNLTFTL